MIRLLFIFLTITSLQGIAQTMNDQKLLNEFNDIKGKLSDESKYVRLIDIIDKLESVDAKLLGYNETPLYMMCKIKSSDSTQLYRRLELVKLLLDKGANPNLANGTYQMSPIYIIENEKTFDVLIEHGADVNFKSEYVHIFNEYTSFERVKKVLDLGLDTDYNVSYGNLYIHIFLKKMDSKTLSLLLERVPEKVNEYDNLGWTFVHYTASGVRADLLEVLLEKKVVLNKLTKSENEGNYGYDNGVKVGSNCLDIIYHLKSEYVERIGEKDTNELINKIKLALTTE